MSDGQARLLKDLSTLLNRKLRCLSALLATLAWTGVMAQQNDASLPLSDGPRLYTTFEQNTRIQVSVVTRGLSHPWSMAFLPDTATSANPLGDALITERGGRVRLLRDGRLGVESVADLEPLHLDQLFDIALHPDFRANGLVYLTYIKKAPREEGTREYRATTALARGRFDGARLVDVRDVFVADAWGEKRGGDAAAVVFGPDGTLFLSSSHRREPRLPQRLGTHVGKVLRLRPDGSVPPDNPFVDEVGVAPEIFSYGHRTIMDLTVHPDTSGIWELENGPQGGDEVNVLRAGRDYGWPDVTYGRDYDGSAASEIPWRPGAVQPELFWVPSITGSSLMFYDGEAFPAWQNDLFVSAMIEGRIPGTGHLQRIVFNEHGEVRRERMLTDLGQRLRHVAQGPDDHLYVLTDEDAGVLLRIAPAPAGAPGTDSASPDDGSVSSGRAPLFGGHDCASCHDLETMSTGPAYLAIAARYEATEDNVELLARRIIEGSIGVWGETPMAAHSGLDESSAAQMARTILELE